LPDIQAISYGISIISKELMIKRRNVVGYKPLLYPLSEVEAVDIDTELEFEFAEYLYNKKC
jgi:CMP-N,N'-diacetyllegionaminic acid synthase